MDEWDVEEDDDREKEKGIDGKNRKIDAKEQQVEEDGVQGMYGADIWSSMGEKTSREDSRRPNIGTRRPELPDTDHRTLPLAFSIILAPTTISRPIFQRLVILVHGSTYPQISDHALKQLLATHGAVVAQGLTRKTVTHVIIGKANTLAKSKTGAKGAGGGLAASKIQREIERIGRKGVKFVGVEWVLDSVKEDMRLSEIKFAVEMGKDAGMIGAAGVRSVRGMLLGKS